MPKMPDRFSRIIFHIQVVMKFLILIFNFSVRQLISGPWIKILTWKTWKLVWIRSLTFETGKSLKKICLCWKINFGTQLDNFGLLAMTPLKKLLASKINLGLGDLICLNRTSKIVLFQTEQSMLIYLKNVK